MITLYTENTPNGYKISMMLELLGLQYKAHQIDFSTQEQKSDWYLAMNPNGKIPVIIDHDNNDKVIVDSGAILIYLAEQYGQHYFPDQNRYEVLE